MTPGRFRRWFTLDHGRSRVDAEVDEELRFHFERTVAELMARGLDPERARAEAERRFGDVHRTRTRLIDIDSDREIRTRRSERAWTVLQDCQLALRSLAREPGFGLTVIVTLALGIGVNATMVGLVDRLLFRPPAAVDHPERLVQLSLTQVHPTFGRFTNTGLAWPDFELADRTPGLAGAAAFYTARLTLGRGLEARPIRVTMATADFFPLLGVEPLAGRFHTAEEDRPGGTPVVVLSEGFWRRHFGADPAALGSSLPLGSTLYTVIGVAPRGFSGIELNAIDAWVPVASGAPEMLGPSSDWRTTRNWEWVRVVARLAEGARPEAAEAALTTAYRAAIAGDADRNQNATFRFHSIIPGRGPEAPRSTRVALWLAAVSVIVLLITCANVANLLLARGARRTREIAVRLALGIRRRRLIGGLLLEALLLAIGGGGLALLVAHWGGQAVRRFLLPNIDWTGAPVDGRVIAVAAVVTLLTVILAALLPAIQTSRPDLGLSLKAGSPGAGRDPRHARTRRALLVLQTALSVLLLSGAGLFVKSLRQVAQLDLGFEPRGLLLASADLSGSGLSPEQRINLVEGLLDEVQALPGVTAAGIGVAIPFQTRNSTQLRLPGRDSVPVLPTGSPSYNAVTPDFIATMQMRLVRGRGIQPADHETATPVMIVNETMARTWWPGEDPIGRCVLINDPPVCVQVVGIVQDARREELREDPTMQYLVPLAHAERLGLNRDRHLFIRADGDALSMIEPVRRTILSAAPGVAYVNVTPYERFLEPHIQPWRLGASMFGIFGLLALVVAAVGLYGVMAYSVATRGREFGVRGALGASAGNLAGQVVREGLAITGLGVALGGVAALAATGLIASMLFETNPRDPRVFVGVGATLLVVAALASLVPALRAARTAPAEALRNE